MNSQQTNEVAFWRDWVTHNGGPDGFVQLRTVTDFESRTAFFPDLLAETGKGLDYGCGLVSIFDDCDLTMDAYDPLQAEYDAIYSHYGTARYVARPRGPYDFACCFNVIDHTPDPHGLLKALAALLVEGGRLYFEVNFDPELYPAAHYALWRPETVTEHLSAWNLVRSQTRPSGDLDGQMCHEAVYLRP